MKSLKSISKQNTRPAGALFAKEGKIPDNVSLVLNTLAAAGFEAFIVGGCVRDVMLGKTQSTAET